MASQPPDKIDHPQENTMEYSTGEAPEWMEAIMTPDMLSIKSMMEAAWEFSNFPSHVHYKVVPEEFAMSDGSGGLGVLIEGDRARVYIGMSRFSGEDRDDFIAPTGTISVWAMKADSAAESASLATIAACLVLRFCGVSGAAIRRRAHPLGER